MKSDRELRIERSMRSFAVLFQSQIYDESLIFLSAPREIVLNMLCCLLDAEIIRIYKCKLDIVKN